MLRFIVGIFVMLHGLVHLLYLGQSRRLFELQAGLIWPDGSWVLSRFFGDGATRSLASVACGLAALLFLAGGFGILAGQTWWRFVVVGAAVFSAVLFVLCWDGRMQKLDANGGVGLLIDTAMLVSLLILQWPAFGF